MRLSDTLGTRGARVALLAAMVVGWVAITVGLIWSETTVLVVGAILTGITNLALAKVILESSSATRSLPAVERRIGRAQKRIERLDSGQRHLVGRVDDQGKALRDLRTRANRDLDDLARAQREASGRLADQVKSTEQLRREVVSIDKAHQATRHAVVATRAVTDKLAARARISHSDPRLRAVARNEVEAPVLSIGIPSFERPGQLADLLTSIKREVELTPPGLVEVCITDDASPDPEVVEIALAFAEENRYASLRVHPTNIGLERNLIGVGDDCRAKHLIVIGNDDLLVPGALQVMLGDLAEPPAPVMLYSKGRINLDGSPRDAVPGSIPIDLGEGQSHLFPTLIDCARRQGLLSTFGFSGQLVIEREPFMRVDPAPYHDLTMYSRSCVLIEAFSSRPVFYRNQPIVLHRTPTPAEKHAEAIGRPDEQFMGAGLGRRSGFFGTTLAAAIQRLVDRGALTIDDLVTMPENLMSPLPLLEWVAQNRAIDPTLDSRLRTDVVADADRLFSLAASRQSAR